MKFVTFPSFRKNDSLVQLTDLLSVVPENNWTWAILDFYGIGHAPNNLSMDDFEKLVRSSPQGVFMTWSELNEFSNSLEQIYDCLIIAVKSPQDIRDDQLKKEIFDNCEVVIEMFDSTKWSIWAKEKALMKKILSVY